MHKLTVPVQICLKMVNLALIVFSLCIITCRQLLGDTVTLIAAAESSSIINITAGDEDGVIVLEEGQSVNLSCLVDPQLVPVESVLFELNGKEVQNSSTSTVFTIQYTNDTGDVLLGGVYSCTIDNGTDVIESMNSIAVYFAPSIAMSPTSSLLATNGSNVSLSCSARGYPAMDISIHWFHLSPDTNVSSINAITDIVNSSLLSYSSISVEVTPVTSNLSIEPIQFKDHGQYICLAILNISNYTDRIDKLTAVSKTAIITVSPSGSVSVDNFPDFTANRSTTVSFTCSAQGGPNTEFRWVKDSVSSVDTSDLPMSLNNVVSNDNVLTIDSINGSSGGDYSCVAFNDAGSGVVNVTLYVSPEILQDPMNAYMDVNERVVLTCVADSFPPPEYQWQRWNNTQFYDILGETNSSFVIEAVDFSDVGRYHCVVTTPTINEMEVSEVAVITVSPVGSVDATPSDQIGSRGSSSSFNCSAKGGPMNEFRWVKGNELIGTFDDSSLPINVNSTLDDLQNVESMNNELEVTVGSGQTSAQTNGGDYTCFVINEAGFENSTVTLYILPEVVEHPTDQFVNDGDLVTLTCIGDSFPAPRYQWQRWNMSTETYEPLQGQTNSTLEFSSISYEDFGRYRCMVLTDIINQNVNSNSATITVSPEGSVMIDPQTVNSMNGSFVTLTCSARGGPNNTFQWTYLRTGNVVSTSYQYIFTSTIYTGGDYQCTVTNDAGNGTDNATVNVGPIITVNPQSVNVSIVRENITLTCSAIGVPVPSITWVHNGTALNTDGEVGVFENGLTIELFDESVGSISSRLIIDSALANHTGQYYCNATSSIDVYDPVMSDIALVLVQDVPEPPENVTAVEITSRNVTLAWDEPHDNNAPILRYTVFYTNPSFILGGVETDVSTLDETETLLITDLHPGQEYMFTVTATNEEGDSERSVSITVTTLEEEPAGFPQNLTASTLNSTAIEVSWQSVLVDEANGIITQYRIIGVPSESFADTVTITINDNSILSVVVGGLEEFVKYNFSISARTVIGFGPSSPNFPATTDQDEPSGFPQNLIATTTNSTAIEVSWDGVLDSEANGIITRYNITGVPDESFANTVYMSVDSTVSSVQFTNLEEFAEYNFTIRASTVVGFGPSSPGVTARTDQDEPAGFPQNFNASTINSTAIEVLWQPVLDSEANGIITQYRIIGVPDESFADTVTITINSILSVVVGGLEEFVKYNFSIRASTVIGFGPSSPEVTATTAQDEPSGFPQNLTATTINSTAIKVSWDDVLDSEANGIITHYNITGVPDESFANTVYMSVDSTVYSVQFTNLEEFVEYNFTIRASTVVGFGPSSHGVTARTDQDEPSGFPQNLTASTLNSTAIEVSWEDVPPIDTNGIITQYRIIGVPDESFADTVTITINDNSMLSIVVGDLEEFVDYTFTIRASTAVGFGPSSPEVSARTDQDEPSDFPQNLIATTINSTAIEVSWQSVLVDEANGIITQYRIIGVPSESFADTVNITINADNSILSVVVGGLEEFVEYNFSISASTIIGFGPSSPEVSATTDQDEPSDFPQNLTATTISSTAIEVSWDDVLDSEANGIITRYNITGVPDESFANTVYMSVDSSVFTVQFTNLEEFVEYTFTIRASTVVGFGPSSPGVTARTDEAAPSAPSLNFTVTNITANSISLEWLPPPDRDINGIIREYRIMYHIIDQLGVDMADLDNTILVEVIDGNTTLNTILDNLDNFTEYEISIRAVTIANGSLTTLTQRTDENAPEVPPINVTATTNSTTSIIVRWSQPPLAGVNGIIDNYEIRYGLYDNTTMDITRNITTWIISGNETFEEVFSGLEEFVQYGFQVRAITVAPGPYSEVVQNLTFQAVVDDPNSGSAVAMTIYIAAGVCAAIIICCLVVVIVCICYQCKVRQSKSYIFEPEFSNNNQNKERPMSELITVDALIKSMAVYDESSSDHTLFDPTANKHRPISAKNFCAHVKKMHMNDDYHFSMEYPSVEPNHTPTSEATFHPKNKAKNRYTNITAYDHTRVKLQSVLNHSGKSTGSDYINANFINGYEAPDKYIATQGPSPVTMADFWRMVWEQESATIVMLTNLEENGRTKCHMYWPTLDKRVSTYGQITVHIDSEVQLPCHTIRRLSLKSYNNDDERIVRQFHYTAWPDFGVPDSPTSVLKFIRKVNSCDSLDDGPIIVHCSAGVGRTGTFITIASQMERLKELNTIDIFNFIQNMRRQRCNMVQSLEQYVFIHDAILEVIECGDTEVSVMELDNYYKKLCAFTYTGGVKLQTEFCRLNESVHSNATSFAGTLPCNIPKNRVFNIIPYDMNRCKLSSRSDIDGSDYINASIVQGYWKDRVYIATQNPLAYTEADFWRMVWERRCTTIVMVSDEEEEVQEMNYGYTYWPRKVKGSVTHECITIVNLSMNQYLCYTVTEMKVSHSKGVNDDILLVKHFHYTNWPAKNASDSTSEILSMREQMEIWHGRYSSPIVIHCSDGSCRTGAYIAICNLIDRLGKEGVIDVFQTVRELRLCRPRMVQYLDHYDFIYKVIIEFVACLD